MQGLLQHALVQPPNAAASACASSHTAGQQQVPAFHQLAQKYIKNLLEKCREQLSTSGNAAVLAAQHPS